MNTLLQASTAKGIEVLYDLGTVSSAQAQPQLSGLLNNIEMAKPPDTVRFF